MRCEYYGFMVFCAIGLGAQVWWLANEFTRSSLPLITRDFGHEDVLPAITVCIPLKYTVQKSEWLNYLVSMFESFAYDEALKQSKDWFYEKDGPLVKCRLRIERFKRENK